MADSEAVRIRPIDRRLDVPFRSKRQMRWMFANHPDMAERWAKETPNEKSLPEKAKPRKKRKKVK